MKFLALEVENYPVTWTEVDPDLLKAEARHVYDLQQAGLIRQINFRADTKSAVIEWECSSIQQVEDLIAAFPLVMARYIHFELIQLVPYSGFDRLVLQED
jgi:hypothetical protein